MKRRSRVIGGRMSSRASMWDPFCRAKKHMGFLLRQYPWPLATRLRAKKEIVCNQKVPTRGFSAKKEVVWRDLSAIFHSRIFGEKGNGVARPPCHFPPLGKKGRWVAAHFWQKRKPCGATSKSAKYSLFLCVPAQIKWSLNAHMGDVNRKWWVGFMESHVHNGCAQRESILDAAGDIIVCSTEHYWGAQWGCIMCSMERYSGCSLVN